MISIADKKFRGRDKIVQKMTKDGLVDENLRTGEQKSATVEEKPEQEDSAKETAEKEADEEPIVEEERCMDAGDGEEDAPRHHSTAKQSADYYKAHQEDGKPKDAPAESDAEPPTKKGRLSFEDEKGGIVRGVGMGVKKVAKKGVDTATGFAHQKVHQVEKDNSGVEAAHKSEEAAERLHHFVKGRKKPKDKSARAEKRGGEDQKSSRLKFSESEGGTAENAAEPPLKKKQPQPPPTAAGGESKTVGAKFYQKKQYKDAYAAAKRGQKAGTVASKQAAAATNTITEKAKAAVQEIVVQNKTLWVSIGVGILLVMVMLGAFSSCGAAIQGTGSTFVGTTYPSKDEMCIRDRNYADDDNPLGMKSDFILSLCELIMGARDGMEPEEKSVIDRCLPLVYQKYLNDPKPENMPTLGDLYDCLREQKERQAQRIATALEIYVNGSLRVFNHQTNVELDNRIICFDIKELGKQLKKLGMLIVQDQVWNRVTINRNSKKNTRYYIDEFHLLLKEEQTAAYLSLIHILKIPSLKAGATS